MSDAAELPALAMVLTAAFLVVGAAVTAIGSLGLLRLRTFYERVHAPTLGTTLGVGCIAMSSIIYFSALTGRLVIHEILIVLFVTVTTPITLMVLVRAAVFRGQAEADAASLRNTETEPHPRQGTAGSGL